MTLFEKNIPIVEDPSCLDGPKIDFNSSHDVEGELLRLSPFLCIVRERQDLEGLLEAIFLTYMLKKKSQKIKTSILLHPDNEQFVQCSGLFDTIELCYSREDIQRHIHSYKAKFFYIPHHDHSSQFSTFFTRASVRTVGFREDRFSRFLGMRNLQRQKDLAFLFQLDGEAKNASCKNEKNQSKEFFQMKKILSADIHGLPSKPFIWFSGFDGHDLNESWPPSYFLRLERMLEKLDIQIVISVPIAMEGKLSRDRKKRNQIEYLKKKSRKIVFLENLSPSQRASGMQKAQVICGLSGQETLLALLLGKKVLALHDMKSYISRSHLSFFDMENTCPEHPIERNDKKKISLFASFAKKPLQHPLFSNAQWEKYLHQGSQNLLHLVPSVSECIQDCNICSYDSCVNYISPERVFADLKKIFL